MSLMALAVAMSPEAAKTLGIVLVMVSAFVSAVLYPIARAYARRLEGSAGTAALRQELGEVYARLDELQQGQERIAELEGRLDFAERLLAQQREPERIPGKAGAP
ncbi:MAG: hypothetical protein JNM53_06685 [Gemmatimonadetes bacterium]|nr:hypothetical protein [Gemmatimonadota bacterium]